jgi:hypothetical protein
MKITRKNYGTKAAKGQAGLEKPKVGKVIYTRRIVRAV